MKKIINAIVKFFSKKIKYSNTKFREIKYEKDDKGRKCMIYDHYLFTDKDFGFYMPVDVAQERLDSVIKAYNLNKSKINKEILNQYAEELKQKGYVLKKYKIVNYTNTVKSI